MNIFSNSWFYSTRRAEVCYENANMLNVELQLFSVILLLFFQVKSGLVITCDWWPWAWPSSTCATHPALCLGSSAARRPTSHSWPCEVERKADTLLLQRVNTSSSGTYGKERRLTLLSLHLQTVWFTPDLNSIFLWFAAGSDPAGPKTWGDLPAPFARRHPHRRGLRGRRRADIQPVERREQRLLQRPQVCCQCHPLRRAGSSTGHWIEGAFWFILQVFDLIHTH